MSFNGELFVNRLLECYAIAHDENEKPLQKQLAADLGIQEKTISNWNNGMFPNGQTLEKIVEKYNPSLDYLFDNSDDNYIFMKRDIIDLLKIIMLFDYRQRYSQYEGYYISFDTQINKDGVPESTITFKVKNQKQHDYILSLFSSYNALQKLQETMDSEHNPNYMENEYISLIDHIINKAKNDSKIDLSPYFKDETEDKKQ